MTDHPRIVLPVIERGRRYRLLDGREVQVESISTSWDRIEHDTRTTVRVLLLAGAGDLDGGLRDYDRSALAALIVEELP